MVSTEQKTDHLRNYLKNRHVNVSAKSAIGGTSNLALIGLLKRTFVLVATLHQY